MNSDLVLQVIILIVAMAGFTWGVRRLIQFGGIDKQVRIRSVILAALSATLFFSAAWKLFKEKGYHRTGSNIVIQGTKTSLTGGATSYGYTVAHDTSPKTWH